MGKSEDGCVTKCTGTVESTEAKNKFYCENTFSSYLVIVSIRLEQMIPPLGKYVMIAGENEDYFLKTFPNLCGLFLTC